MKKFKITKDNSYLGILIASDLFDAITKVYNMHTEYYFKNLAGWGSAFFTGDGGCNIFPHWRIDKLT